MSNENYLKELFIDEAKPALQRHSGGGGSSDLIECDSLPTSNIEEGKIYRARWTESFEQEESYDAYLYIPGSGSAPCPVNAYVDTIDDVTNTSMEMVDICKQDGKAYIVRGGVVMDYLIASDMSPETSAQLGLVDASFVPDSGETRILIYTLYKPAGVVSIEHHQIAIPSSEHIEVIQQSGDKWIKLVGGLMKTLFGLKSSIEIFSGSDSLMTTEGIISYDDTSEVTDMSNMFNSCDSLRAVTLFDTSRVTDMRAMFYNCIMLHEIPSFDTSRVTNMGSMFCNCGSLHTVPSFDIRSVIATGNMFYKCTRLSKCWIKNIGISLTVGSNSNITYGHLLTVDSLTHLIYELRDTGSSKTLTVGSANLEKLASVYVKTVEITDEMRAEDDLIDEKLPFVVCESTDEGAILITDYVGFKNWSLA